MGLELITGLAFAASVFLYLCFKINGVENGGDHIFLRIFLLAFGIFSLYSIPAAINESLTTCTNLQTNMLAVTTGNQTNTTYSYTNTCTTQTSSVQTTFQKIMSWFWRVLAIYALLYFSYGFFKETTAYERWFGT